MQTHSHDSAYINKQLLRIRKNRILQGKFYPSRAANVGGDWTRSGFIHPRVKPRSRQFNSWNVEGLILRVIITVILTVLELIVVATCDYPINRVKRGSYLTYLYQNCPSRYAGIYNIKFHHNLFHGFRRVILGYKISPSVFNVYILCGWDRGERRVWWPPISYLSDMVY
jgi:hypothetical protein